MRRQNIVIASLFLLLGACTHYASDDYYSSAQRYYPGDASYYSLEPGVISPLFWGVGHGAVDIRFEYYDYNTYVITDGFGMLLGYAIFDSPRLIRVVDASGRLTNYMHWVDRDRFRVTGYGGIAIGFISIGGPGYFHMNYGNHYFGRIGLPRYGFYPGRRYGGRWVARRGGRNNDRPTPVPEPDSTPQTQVVPDVNDYTIDQRDRGDYRAPNREPKFRSKVPNSHMPRQVVPQSAPRQVRVPRQAPQQAAPSAPRPQQAAPAPRPTPQRASPPVRRSPPPSAGAGSSGSKSGSAKRKRDKD